MRSSLIIAALLMFCTPFIGLAAQDLDADSSHPVPSSYDFRYDFGVREYTTSSSQDVLDLYEMGHSDQDLALINEILFSSKRTLTIASSYCPDWISISFHSSQDRTFVTITPGAVCDDLFWIKFNVTGGRTLLLTFDIKVSDSGSVVPAVDENVFTLDFDVRGGSTVRSVVKHSGESSVVFDLSEKSPVKQGFTFKGWSVDENGESILSGSYTMRVSGSSHEASATLYAVWEEVPSGMFIPTLFDGIIELVNNPLVLVCSILGMFGLAFFIRGRMS